MSNDQLSSQALPVRALQFGSGNFLRAFIDWMLQKMNRRNLFNGRVRIIQRSVNSVHQAFAGQDGKFHVVLRGMENGQITEQIEVVDCVEKCIADSVNWDEVMESALLPELRFIFSNTTEAGIEYQPGVLTFPAKVAHILAKRCQAGLPGLIIIPCELIERNGDELKKCVIKYLDDPQIIDYVEKECIFCNTLVDRIVSGAPNAADAERFAAAIGSEDRLLTCCEPFFFLAIEAPDCVRTEFPADQAGLNVVFTDDLAMYRTSKVRFLNGAHTSSVLGAHCAGLTYVDEMIKDPFFGDFIRRVLFDEVMCTIDLPEAQKRSYAEAVLERFANPFAQHKLLSIALNSVSKWRVRVLPTLLDYLKITGSLPECLTMSMAYLINFYRTCEINDAPEVKAFFAAGPAVEDILGQTDFWGMDLNTIPGFTEKIRQFTEVK